MVDEGQNFDTNPSLGSQEAPIEASSPNEKMLSQSEVDRIVGRVRQEEAQKRERMLSEQSQSRKIEPSSNLSNQGYSSSESEIRRLAAEEAQRLRDEWTQEAYNKSEAEQAQRIVKNFWDKVSAGKDKYQDFDEITGNIDYARFPNVVQLLAEHIDNSHDVLYELGKNRLKMSQLESLSYMSPKDAIIEAKRLAQSIKDNESASKHRSPNAPLSQQRPSNVGTDAGRVLSTADYKKIYKG